MFIVSRHEGWAKEVFEPNNLEISNPALCLYAISSKTCSKYEPRYWQLNKLSQTEAINIMEYNIYKQKCNCRLFKMCQHIIIIASHRSKRKLHDGCIIRIRVELIASITPNCIINSLFIYETHSVCFFFRLYARQRSQMFSIYHHRLLHDHHN